MKAKVLSLNISEKKGTAKKQVSEALFVVDHGIEGDAHAGNWHRQVSLLSQKSIDKMIAQGVDNLIAGSFAENITTEGIELHLLPVGTQLQIGETIQEVTQIGKKCHSKCAIFQQIGSCIMPTEGIFTKVIKGGIVKPGDSIEILNS